MLYLATLNFSKRRVQLNREVLQRTFPHISEVVSFSFFQTV